MKKIISLMYLFIYGAIPVIGQSNSAYHSDWNSSILQNLVSSYQKKRGMKESMKNQVCYYDLFLHEYYSDTLAIISMGQKDLFHWPGNKEIISKFTILQAQLGCNYVRIYPDALFSTSYIQELFNAEVLDIDSLLNIDSPTYLYEPREYTFKIKNSKVIEFVQIGVIHGPYPNLPDEPALYKNRYSWNEKELKESVRYLKSSRYRADTNQYHFSVISDSLRACEIKEYFHLDSLYASDSKTWVKAMAISRFVSTNIPHIYLEVTMFHPRRINAIDLWLHNRDVYRGLNSHLHAILNNELMQAAGLTARYITCMPKKTDYPDTDRHVVNEVWLPELDKWAFIDSDLDGHYFTDLQGTPLSLLEIREKLGSGEQMLMYKGFSQTPSEPDYYYALIAKYAYWFYCWETLRFSQEDYTDEAIKNTETNRIIEIVPLGFIPSTENHIQRVITTDASRFWSSSNVFSF